MPPSLFRASFAACERDILTSGVRPLSLRGRLSGLGVWAIWTTLVVCALAPRPQTAAVPEATIVPPAQAAPVRNYVHPEELRSDVVWPDPQVALRWQLAPTSRDLPPAEYDRPFDGEVKIFGMNSTKRPYGGRVAVLTTSAREIRR